MAQIHFNGRDYQLVTVGELTLGEAMVVWDYAKISIDQISEIEGFHPGVVAALIHVSVARGEPGETAATIRREVAALPISSLEEVFIDNSEEVEQLPPPSEPGATGPSKSSGEGSSSTGTPDRAPSQPNGTGSPGSATGATSDQAISAR